SRVPESGSLGSVRGALSNERPYREDERRQDFSGFASNVVKAAPERSVRDQILRQEIDERSHTLTGEAARGDSVQIGVGSHERVESGDKCARGKLLADIQIVSQDDAVAVERPL